MHEEIIKGKRKPLIEGVINSHFLFEIAKN
jgi:hypothetical protein